MNISESIELVCVLYFCCCCLHLDFPQVASMFKLVSLQRNNITSKALIQKCMKGLYTLTLTESAIWNSKGKQMQHRADVFV